MNKHGEIGGSCLRLVLDLAKNRWQPGCGLDLIDLVQDGNVTLVRTIKEFNGSGAEAFLAQLTKKVENTFAALLKSPGSS